MALTATMMLDPDMLSAAIAGLRVKPAGSRTPAAIGIASGVVADGPGEVLVHLAHGAAADLDGGGDVLRVGAHEHDVGGLDRDVGAGADRDPDVGLGERGGVVDAVADHRHLAALVLELFDSGRLVLGQHFGDHVLDADLGGDPLRGGVAVAGQHHRAHSQLAQGCDGGLGGVARGVGDRDDPGRGAVERDLNGGAALSGQRCCALGEAVEADVLALQQPRVADGEPVTLDGGDRAEAGDRLEVVDPRELEVALAGGVDDRLSEWVLAVALGGGDEPQQLVLADARRRWRFRPPLARRGSACRSCRTRPCRG